MKLNSYFYRARLGPALLTSIPGLIFINKIVIPSLGPGLNEILVVLPWITHWGLSFALLFLLVQINRVIAKEIFQRLYFKEEKYMPTTNFLLRKDTFFDEQIKDRIRNKITNQFQITIPDESSEVANEKKSRNIIVSAVSQIRISLKDNQMLFRHNIEYGFIRNSLGGSLLALIFSVLIFFYGLNNQDAGLINGGILLSVIYLIPILLSRILIRKYGRYYAKILYEQFLSI